MKKKPIALIDMDGTVADFDTAMRAELEALRAPNEDPKLDETAYEELPHMKARRRLVKSKPGFWSGLSKIQAGFDIIELLSANDFKLHVLTKGPKNSPAAYMEKIQWCREHMPEGTPVTISDDKGLVYGKVLVDDWPSYIEAWVKWRPRGYVISVAQPWNEGIEKQYDNLFRYDPKVEGSLERLGKFINYIKATI